MKKKEIPLIEVRGKNYEAGYQIGARCGDKINRLLESSKKKYSSVTGKPFEYFVRRGRKIAGLCMKNYSGYINEIKGITDGANVNFEEYFALNFEDEVFDFLYYKCTTLFLKNENGIYLGHNEDWSSDFIDKLYFLKLKQKGKPDVMFLSYLGPPQFIIASLNSAGIAFTANSLFVSHRFGIPEAIMLRSLADAKNIKEAIKDLTVKSRGMGMNSIIISKDKIVDIENSLNNSAIIDVKKDYFVHTNHPLKLKGEHYGGSVIRYNRVKEMIEKSSKRDIKLIKNILSDHESSSSICLHKGNKYNEATLASIIIDLSKMRMLIAHGNPCRNEYKEYKL